MASALRIRPAVHNLSTDQLAAFRSAYAQMQAISDNRSFSHFAGLHGGPNWYCWHHQGNAHFVGQMQIFLPWHRAYLYTFEMAMRDFVADVTLPWWDWTLRPPRQAGIPEAFGLDTVDGAPNPLFSSNIDLPKTNPPIEGPTARGDDQDHDPAGLPSQADVDRAMGRTDWNDFCAQVEDIHDNVHGWVGGDMGQVSTAAFDPIFYSHHAMIDRIWAVWQARNGNGNVPTELLDVVLTPFPLKVRDVLSVNALGYDYAAAATVAVGV